MYKQWLQGRINRVADAQYAAGLALMGASRFTVPRPFLREHAYFLLGHAHFRCLANLNASRIRDLAHLGPLGLAVYLRKIYNTRMHVISNCADLLYMILFIFVDPTTGPCRQLFVIDANQLKYWKQLLNFSVSLNSKAFITEGGGGRFALKSAKGLARRWSGPEWLNTARKLFDLQSFTVS
jgi:hypothetical protein